MTGELPVSDVAVQAFRVAERLSFGFRRKPAERVRDGLAAAYRVWEAERDAWLAEQSRTSGLAGWEIEFLMDQERRVGEGDR